MAQVQAPLAPPTTTSRLGRGRILRVLTLGKPQQGKAGRKFTKSKEGKEEAHDQISSGESGDRSSDEGQMLMPPRPAASDGGVLSASPLSGYAESFPPISPARPDDRSPDTEPSPITPNDPFIPSSMDAKQSPQSPTFFKRFSTRLRSMSRSKDERPKFSALQEPPPPVPNMPVPKDFGLRGPDQRVRADIPNGTARPTGPIRRISKANLFSAFGKSTSSLVPSPTTEQPVPQIMVHTSVDRRSSVPGINGPPLISKIEIPQSKDIDPAMIPLPESPVTIPGSIDAVAEPQKEQNPSANPPSQMSLQDSSLAPRGLPLPQGSPQSKRSAGQSTRSSKFFVGDSDDDEDDPQNRRFSLQTDSSASQQGSPRPRSATTGGAPGQARTRRRPSTSGSGAAGKEKRKTMFSGLRKSVDTGTAMFDPRTHRRGASIDTTSSTDSTGAIKRVNPVSPTMHSGGFMQQEEKIKDPESRALTEIAFM